MLSDTGRQCFKSKYCTVITSHCQKKEEYQRKQQEKQQDKQRRLEEADRLEKEASKPVQPTQENINRQMKLLQEAQRLREMP